MDMYENLKDSLNIKKKCEEYRVGLWGCPQFLFVVMGVIIIASIIITDVVARQYADPEIGALIAIGVTTILLVVGQAIVSSFERIAETSRVKSEFISIVSHELRNPLSAIKWQINMLTDKDMNLSDKEKAEALEVIYVQNKKMLQLVNGMLEIHKVQEGVFDFHPESFSVSDLVKRVLEEYKPIAKRRDVSFKFSIDDNNHMAFADMKKIQVVIEHFVDNAIKYGKEGGDVTVAIMGDGKNVKLSVTDQGVGIPKSDVKKIFSKFFRAHNVLRYKIEGIGLGLYMARSIVEGSGGRIGFTSNEGHGSTFWFTVPAYAEKRSV